MAATPTLTGNPVLDFDAIYQEAHGSIDLVPWADGRAHPALVSWLNAIAPSVVRCGSRVMVVGCGLGDDARETSRRGYDVTAFDHSPTAIEWARSIDPHTDVDFHTADLFDLPRRWRHRFDLVIEVNTIQSLRVARRHEVVRCISELVSPRGHLLVIARHAEAPVADADGPPWAVTSEELMSATKAAGLEPVGELSVFLDSETPPVRRIRALFHRARVIAPE